MSDQHETPEDGAVDERMAGQHPTSVPDAEDVHTAQRLTRREVLRRVGLTVAATPLATGLAACTAEASPVAQSRTDPAPATAVRSMPDTRPAMRRAFMGQPPVRLPAGRTGNGMNVVIVMLDTLRRDHIGAYGARGVATPAIDALARTSTRFTQARPEAMPTVQVRRCVHTGQRTFPTRDWWPRKGGSVRMPGWEPIPEAQVTLAEILGAVGYATAFVTDVPHLFHPAMNFHRGFQHWELIRGQHTNVFQAGADRRLREEDHQAPRVFRAAADLLAAASRLQPFLMLIDSYDPHEPWDPPVSYIRRYDDPVFRGDEPLRFSYGSSSTLSGAQMDRMRVLYRAEVTMADAWLGRFLDDLERRGLLDDTLVVLLSDHGVLLGEHGLIGKPVQDSLWPEITDIPLLIRHPEDRTQRVDDRPVSTHDVVPTVLSALDIAPPVALPGLDLAPVVRGTPGRVLRRGHLTMGYAGFAQIRTDRWAMTTNPSGTSRRLYDLRRDGFSRDVASRHPDVVRRLAGQIERDAGGPLPVHDADAVVARLGERT